MLLAPSGKGRKRQKKGEKGRFRLISRKGGQTPLKPPFVTPPFAAAQLKSNRRDKMRTNLGSRAFLNAVRSRTGHFQVTVYGVTVCPFSRHEDDEGNQRSTCL